MLDANIVSYVIRKNSPKLTARFEQTSPDEVVLSSVTAGEMLYGIAKRPHAIALSGAVRLILSSVTVLPWTRDTAYQYARLRVFAEENGATISLSDLMIAAHALVSICINQSTCV